MPHGAAESTGRAISISGKLKADQLVLAKGGKPSKRAVEIDIENGEIERAAFCHLGGLFKASGLLAGQGLSEQGFHGRAKS